MVYHDEGQLAGRRSVRPVTFLVFCNEELHYLYSSRYRPIIRVIISRKVRWAGNAARMETAEMHSFSGEAGSEETISKT
jgi:hypothetical protein